MKKSMLYKTSVLLLMMLTIYKSSQPLTDISQVSKKNILSVHGKTVYSENLAWGEMSKLKSGDSECVNFSINLPKSEYLEGEPVWLELSVNVSQQCNLDHTPLLDPMYGEVKLELINSNGDTIRGHEGILEGIPAKTYPAYIFDVYDITNSFGVGEWANIYSVPRGVYLLKAFIEVSLNKKKITVGSNIANFKVVEPKDIEEKAHAEWIRIEETNRLNKDNVDTVKKLVDNFLVNFSSSAYKERVFATLREGWPQYFLALSPQNRKNFLLNAITTMPDSYYNKYYLSDLTDAGIDKANAQSSIDIASRIKKSSSNQVLNKLCDMHIFYLNQLTKGDDK